MSEMPTFDALPDTDQAQVRKWASAAHSGGVISLIDMPEGESRPSDYNGWLEYFSQPDQIETIRRFSNSFISDMKIGGVS